MFGWKWLKESTRLLEQKKKKIISSVENGGTLWSNISVSIGDFTIQIIIMHPFLGNLKKLLKWDFRTCLKSIKLHYKLAYFSTILFIDQISKLMRKTVHILPLHFCMRFGERDMRKKRSKWLKKWNLQLWQQNRINHKIKFKKFFVILTCPFWIVLYKSTKLMHLMWKGNTDHYIKRPILRKE